MKYSQIQFGKDLYDLDYNDLVQFFDTEKEETLNLEFKSYPAQGNAAEKENSVFKAICGLLNSEGGIIIWGAPVEGRNAQGNTTAEGALTPFTTILDRDRFINKVTGLITPLAIGIRVQQINDANNDSIFVIEVEKSDFKPHQFKDKYYIRLDGQTKVAPHYLISAMMKSVDFPIIKGHLRLKNIENLDGHRISLRFRKLIFNTSPFNNDLNVFIRVVASPGVIIVNNEQFAGNYHSPGLNILSNGRPSMSEFNLIITSQQLIQRNNEVQIMLNFGGEKSPSKVSSYKYSLANLTLGNVEDENTFLIEKKENSLPSDANNKTAEDQINELLDL
ncbi:AlbA family DNA-binding domain-containing protein [Aquimarina algiphila]|uniref:AlbA family DNA-binding domain-containing protein n=1 Tax=Aquimarina algiphila TaxID=2047982 RepID=UPI00232E85A6|nr:ATP-binding protein [Aquimarina algiphila]